MYVVLVFVDGRCRSFYLSDRFVCCGCVDCLVEIVGQGGWDAVTLILLRLSPIFVASHRTIGLFWQFAQDAISAIFFFFEEVLNKIGRYALHFFCWTCLQKS